MVAQEWAAKTVNDYSGYAQEGNMEVQARTRMDGICEKSDGELYRLSLLLTQLCATGLQRLGKPFPWNRCGVVRAQSSADAGSGYGFQEY